MREQLRARFAFQVLRAVVGAVTGKAKTCLVADVTVVAVRALQRSVASGLPQAPTGASYSMKATAMCSQPSQAGRAASTPFKPSSVQCQAHRRGTRMPQAMQLPQVAVLRTRGGCAAGTELHRAAHRARAVRKAPGTSGRDNDGVPELTQVCVAKHASDFTGSVHLQRPACCSTRWRSR